jgi:hypothetical protein
MYGMVLQVLEEQTVLETTRVKEKVLYEPLGVVSRVFLF